jgi:hypothetical protein
MMKIKHQNIWQGKNPNLKWKDMVCFLTLNQLGLMKHNVLPTTWVGNNVFD